MAGDRSEPSLLNAGRTASLTPPGISKKTSQNKKRTCKKPGCNLFCIVPLKHASARLGLSPMLPPTCPRGLLASESAGCNFQPERKSNTETHALCREGGRPFPRRRSNTPQNSPVPRTRVDVHMDATLTPYGCKEPQT